MSTIKGGPPEFRVWIDNYREGKDGQATGIVALKRDGVVLGAPRFTKLTDPEDFEAAAQYVTELGIPSGADAALQEALAAVRTAQQAAGGYSAPVVSKFAPQAKWVVDQLVQDGRFLRCGGNHYYMNGLTHVPVVIKSYDMSVVLRAKFGLNESDRAQSYIVNELGYHTELNGSEVDLYQLAHYKPTENVLYVDAGAGTVYRCDGKEIRKITNGEEGILFRKAHPFFRPWQYIPGAPRRIKPELVDRLSFAEGEDAPLAISEQRLLFLVWMLSFLFRSELPTRPLALAYGQPGSGKTTAFRRVGQILFGPAFQVDSLDVEREDRFWDTVSNLSYVVYDGVDSRPKWLDDALTKVATGTQYSKRRLYSDNQLLTFAVDVFLALTAHTPKFRRADVADRLLIFFFKRVEDDKWLGELEMQEWLLKYRDELMSELLERANKVLTVERVRPKGSTIRLVDFAGLAERIGQSLGYKDQMLGILEKLRSAQTEFASEENPLVQVLDEWCGGIKDGLLNHSRDVLASDLANELGKIAEREGYRWPYANAMKLGHAFRNQKTLLDAHFVIDGGRDGSRGKHYRIRPVEIADQAKLL